MTPATEVEFVEEKGKVYIIKRPGPNKSSHRFRKLRGAATVRLTTDEIMALAREDA